MVRWIDGMKGRSQIGWGWCCLGMSCTVPLVKWVHGGIERMIMRHTKTCNVLLMLWGSGTCSAGLAMAMEREKRANITDGWLTAEIDSSDVDIESELPEGGKFDNYSGRLQLAWRKMGCCSSGREIPYTNILEEKLTCWVSKFWLWSQGCDDQVMSCKYQMI